MSEDKLPVDPEHGLVFVPQGYENLDYNNYDFEKCLTRQDSNGPYDEEDVVAAILKARGAVGIAAGYLRRSRSSLNSWLRSHPKVMHIVEDYKQTELDIVERNTMDSAIIKSDGSDRRFLLQTKGKERGFSTRQEMTGKDGEPLALADLSKMTNEQLRQLKKLAEETKKNEKERDNEGGS